MLRLIYDHYYVLTSMRFPLPVFSFTRTPDRDFRCFYPCERILSHLPIPTRLKD